MQTYGELVYLILDELKLVSDDRVYEEEHIITLINQYRNLLLKQRYSDVRKEIPITNLQSIDIELENVTSDDKNVYTGIYLKSKNIVPSMLNLNAQTLAKVSSSFDHWQGEFTFVDYMQFKYTGYNRWLNSIIYVTIGPDGLLYLKSENPQFLYLKSIKLSSIFENPLEIVSLIDPINETNNKSVLDIQIPIEANLIPLIKEMILKELNSSVYKPADENNNANDDLNKINTK